MNQAAFPLRAPARLVPIGELSRRLGATPRALRHYQDQGLVRSHRVAGNTRGYDLDAIQRLQTVIVLRAVGLSIADIRAVLDLHDAPDAQAQTLRAALSAALQARRDEVDRLETMLERLSTAPVPTVVSDLTPDATALGDAR